MSISPKSERAIAKQTPGRAPDALGLIAICLLRPSVARSARLSTARCPAALRPPSACASRRIPARNVRSGRTGMTNPVPRLASFNPPESLAITGKPRSIASIAMRPNPSYQSDGISSSRDCESTSSMLGTLSSMVTLGRRRICSRSRAVVAHPASPANGYSGNRVGEREKDSNAFHDARIDHQDVAASKEPKRGNGGSRRSADESPQLRDRGAARM